MTFNIAMIQHPALALAWDTGCRLTGVRRAGLFATGAWRPPRLSLARLKVVKSSRANLLMSSIFPVSWKYKRVTTERCARYGPDGLLWRYACRTRHGGAPANFAGAPGSLSRRHGSWRDPERTGITCRLQGSRSYPCRPSRCHGRHCPSPRSRRSCCYKTDPDTTRNLPSNESLSLSPT